MKFKRKGKVDEEEFLFINGMIMFLFLGTSCTTYHFGVVDRASGVPTEFDQTETAIAQAEQSTGCLLYTSPSPRDGLLSRMPSSA